MAFEYPRFLPREILPHKQTFSTIRDDIRQRRDPDFFLPTGTQVYCGLQGSGKTISAVYHATRLKSIYPKSVLVSNLLLNDFKKLPVRFPHQDENDKGKLFNPDDFRSVISSANSGNSYFFFESIEELLNTLYYLKNGKFGVIFLIDEIHTYFNSLESKNIPNDIFNQVSQQRKQRRIIIGTSQLFSRMAKPFREQAEHIIFCQTFLGIRTKNFVFRSVDLHENNDGSLSGSPCKTASFWHTPKIRNSYNTYQIIEGGGSITSYLSTQNYVDLSQPKNKRKIKKIRGT